MLCSIDQLIITESDHLWNDDQRVIVRGEKDDIERGKEEE